MDHDKLKDYALAGPRSTPYFARNLAKMLLKTELQKSVQEAYGEVPGLEMLAMVALVSKF
jgi:hypothetical protein